MNEQTDGSKSEQMGRQNQDGRSDGRVEGWTNVGTDRKVDRCMHRLMDGVALSRKLKLSIYSNERIEQ